MADIVLHPLASGRDVTVLPLQIFILALAATLAAEPTVATEVIEAEDESVGGRRWFWRVPEPEPEPEREPVTHSLHIRVQATATCSLTYEVTLLPRIDWDQESEDLFVLGLMEIP